MRIVIDIDGTISETKKPGQTYADLKVNPGAAIKIRQLKKAGHYIILHTARHMKSTGGNVQLVIEKIGAITEKWLKDNGIVYDEIHFGKPYNQVVIDDRAFVFEGWENLKPENFNGEFLNIVVSLEPGASKKVSGLKPKLIKIFGQNIKLMSCPSAGRLEALLSLSYGLNNFQRLLIVGSEVVSKVASLNFLEEDNLEGWMAATDKSDLNYGFIGNDKWGYVNKVSDKKFRGALPASGIFYFNNGRDFLSCARIALQKGQNDVIFCYNELINRGQKVKAVHV